MHIKFSILLISIFLFTFSQTHGQDNYGERKKGIKKITTYLLPADKSISKETEPESIHYYDRKGRLKKIISKRTEAIYDYKKNGEFSIQTSEKKTGKFLGSEIFTIQKTDSTKTITFLEKKFKYMEDGDDFYRGEDHSKEFASFPKTIKCKDCNFHSEVRYTLDQVGRPISKVEYKLKKNVWGKYLNREKITTYEYVTEEYIIKRLYTGNTHNKTVLMLLEVNDNHDGQLFYRYDSFESLDEFDNEELKNKKPLSYKYNKKGDWIERLEKFGRKKTIRKIKY